MKVLSPVAWTFAKSHFDAYPLLCPTQRPVSYCGPPKCSCLPARFAPASTISDEKGASVSKGVLPKNENHCWSQKCELCEKYAENAGLHITLITYLISCVTSSHERTRNFE